MLFEIFWLYCGDLFVLCEVVVFEIIKFFGYEGMLSSDSDCECCYVFVIWFMNFNYLLIVWVMVNCLW